MSLADDKLLTEQYSIFEEELSSSYRDYSSSVLKRTLPDIFDGLKPVQRRIIYAMYTNGYFGNKGFKKSARVVGDVMGRFHPHGESSIYYTLVRLAQSFYSNITLVEGHGNFGSLEGDEAGAPRYTEVKLSKFTENIMDDISHYTVSFMDNYDSSEIEPKFLPFKIPFGLIIGNLGIAVGFTSNIPQHNLAEVIDATCALIDNNELTVDDLMEYIKGPDFATGCVVDTSTIKQIYTTGRGTIHISSDIVIDYDNYLLKITSISVYTSKQKLLDDILDCINNNKITCIDDVVDHSNGNSINIIIHVNKKFSIDILKNQILKYTAARVSIGCSMLFSYENNIHLLNLKEYIFRFIMDRKKIVISKYQNILSNLKKDLEINYGILELKKRGLMKEVLNKIMLSDSIENACIILREFTNLTEDQINYILSSKIGSITIKELSKVENYVNILNNEIQLTLNLLSSDKNIYEHIKSELLDIRKKFYYNRKTIMDNTVMDIDYQQSEDYVVICNNNSLQFIKHADIKTQGSGRGKQLNNVIDYMYNLNNKDIVVVFSSDGYSYTRKIFDVINNKTFQLNDNSYPVSIIKLNDLNTNNFLIFVTKNGYVKKHQSIDFCNNHYSGRIAIKLEDDSLVKVILCQNNDKLVFVTHQGISLLIETEDIRCFSVRNSYGVIGIRLKDKDYVVDADCCKHGSKGIFIISENGYGRIILLSSYRISSRGTQGVRCIKHGYFVSSCKNIYHIDSKIIISSQGGRLISLNIQDIPSLNSRVSCGNRLFKLDNDIVSNILVL